MRQIPSSFGIFSILRKRHLQGGVFDDKMKTIDCVKSIKGNFRPIFSRTSTKALLDPTMQKTACNVLSFEFGTIAAVFSVH